MWSFAAVLMEMFTGQILFSGHTPWLHTVQIIQLCGMPDDALLAGIDPATRELMTSDASKSLAELYPDIDATALDLVSKLLVYDQEERLSADAVLQHPYFSDYEFEDRPLPHPFDDSYEDELDTPEACLECVTRLALPFQPVEEIPTIGSDEPMDTKSDAGDSLAIIHADLEGPLERLSRQGSVGPPVEPTLSQ
eukprot:m.33919 g.33919  ORF g.33919 m.33919 type:complete len:194 (-) comp9697_c0_seq1:228-809(-)